MKKNKTKINLKEYQKMCKKTARKFNSRTQEISNWGLGLVGEAGDTAGCIKKTIFHGDNQKDGIKENLGDTMWYVAMISNFFGWNLEDVLRENIKKLKKRYPKGFTEKDAARGGKRIDWMGQ